MAIEASYSCMTLPRPRPKGMMHEELSSLRCSSIVHPLRKSSILNHCRRRSVVTHDHSSPMQCPTADIARDTGILLRRRVEAHRSILQFLLHHALRRIDFAYESCTCDNKTKCREIRLPQPSYHIASSQIHTLTVSAFVLSRSFRS